MYMHCITVCACVREEDQSNIVQRTTRACTENLPICTYGDIMCILAIRINVWGHYIVARIQYMYKGPYNLMDVHRVNPEW